MNENTIILEDHHGPLLSNEHVCMHKHTHTHAWNTTYSIFMCSVQFVYMHVCMFVFVGSSQQPAWPYIHVILLNSPVFGYRVCCMRVCSQCMQAHNNNKVKKNLTAK